MSLKKLLENEKSKYMHLFEESNGKVNFKYNDCWVKTTVNHKLH